MSDEKRNWRDIERFFIKLLLREGYNQECAEVLGFYISQTLEDAAALLNVAECNLNSDKISLEETMILIHRLFQQDTNLIMGHKILMTHEVGDLWAEIDKIKDS